MKSELIFCFFSRSESESEKRSRNMRKKFLRKETLAGILHHGNRDGEKEDDEIAKNIRMITMVIFRSVKDIDLYTGGLAETPVPGAVIGPTFLVSFSYLLLLLRYC